MASQLVAFKPSPVVAERCRDLGRTEDVAFSPDQTRLAIASHLQNKILVIQIRPVTENGVLSVLSDACVEIHCRGFARPHGHFWMDDATLAVANREGDVTFVSVPPASAMGEVVQIDPLFKLSEGREGITDAPGSVAAIRLNDEYVDLLVCNNHGHNVSRHILSRTNRYGVLSEARLFEFGRDVPDGISVSSDGALIAVSNHNAGRVEVFRNGPDSGTRSRPAFTLGIPNFPHGVRFAMDDRLILVADAGAPLVHVFASDAGTWKGAKEPLVSIRVMEDDVFRRGNTYPGEGGPKGVDILADGSLFVVSCKEVPIAFFDFRSTRDGLLGTDRVPERAFKSGEERLFETMAATMKGQHAQFGALQAEVAALRERLKPKWYQELDQRVFRWLKRTARKALQADKKK